MEGGEKEGAGKRGKGREREVEKERGRKGGRRLRRREEEEVEGGGRKGERQQQPRGLSKAARGSSVPCAELEIRDVDRNESSEAWTHVFTRVFHAHALSRALCARNCFRPQTGIIQ